MPINYEEKEAQQQKEIFDYLTGQREETQKNVAQSGANVAAAQNNFLGKSLAGLPQAEVAASLQTKLPALNLNTRQAMSERGFNRDRVLQNMIGSQAFQLARQRGLGVSAANDFARRYMQQKEQQAFTSQIDADNQFLAQRVADQKYEYDKQKQLLNVLPEQEDNKLRSGMRLLSQIGSAYALGHYNKKQQAKKDKEKMDQENAERHAQAMRTLSGG